LVNVTRFAASLRTDISPQRKEARPLVSRSDIRLTQHLDSSALGLVPEVAHKWLFPCPLIYPSIMSKRSAVRGELTGGQVRLVVELNPITSLSRSAPQHTAHFESPSANSLFTSPLLGHTRNCSAVVAQLRADGKAVGWFDRYWRSLGPAQAREKLAIWVLRQAYIAHPKHALAEPRPEPHKSPQQPYPNPTPIHS
jgi:hypothetical protein